VTTVVLDAGALIALERRDRRMVTIADELAMNRLTAHLPAGVLAQVWRGSPRQQPLARLVRHGAVRVEPLSEEVALRVGRLLAAAGTSDVVDGHVALLARGLRATVITSDPEDLHKLDPELELITI
jgi:hypothetical protein